MTVTTYNQWVADGSPWHICTPTSDMITLLTNHGVPAQAIGTIGNHSHLTASTPEDHTPYSHTPWPGIQPYSAVLAMDVLPNSAVDWRTLGQQMVADKAAGNPHLACVKYINWTDSNGACWHDSWMPDHHRSSSADTGHLHISFRTDYVTSTVLKGYDPMASGMIFAVYRLSSPGNVYYSNGIECRPGGEWDSVTVPMNRAGIIMSPANPVAGGVLNGFALGVPDELFNIVAGREISLTEDPTSSTVGPHEHIGGTSGPVSDPGK